MVSKVDILKRFYQIYIDEVEDYFEYLGNCYYLCPINNFTYDYHQYIKHLGLNGFQIVNNCFNQVVSMNFILYHYCDEPYQLDTFIQASLQPLQQTIDIIKVKESWCKILDLAKSKVANYAARISHFEHFIVLSYFYQGLGEAAISLLNEIKQPQLIAGVEHFNFLDTYEVLCCPGNLVIASRIKDLASGVKKNLITMEQLDYYLKLANLSNDEIIYLYARLLFPSDFFHLAISQDCNEPQIKKILLEIYQGIDNQKDLLLQTYKILSQYVFLPELNWLK